MVRLVNKLQIFWKKGCDMSNEAKKTLLSIIVPVYKVEKYLAKCIDSILAQTYTNFELILVDDGSPDNCPQICDEYAKKDKRIIVIHKENGGLSDARNAGLEVAKGQYVGFVDSDDTIEPQMYDELIKSIEMNDSDIALCEVNLCYDNGDKIYNNEICLNQVCGTNFSTMTFGPESKKENNQIIDKSIGCWVWRCLFRRSFIKDKRFIKGMWYEDFIFMNNYIDENTKIAIVKKPLYNYLQRDGGIVRTFNKEKYEKRLIFNQEACKIMKNKLSQQDYKAFSYCLLEQMVVDCLKAEDYKVLFKAIKRNKFLMGLKSFKNCKARMKQLISKKKKLSCLLLYFKLFSLYRKLYLRYKSEN